MPELPRVAFVVNGDPAAPWATAPGLCGLPARAIRHSLVLSLAQTSIHRPLHRPIDTLSAAHLLRLRHGRRRRPGGGLLSRVARQALIIDTGDALTEQAKAMNRGPLVQRLTHWLEEFSLAVADHIVVRGTFTGAG